MKSYGSLFPRTVLAAAVALVAAAPVLAQNTTSAITGRVATPEGVAIAGATVVVLHRESGSASTLTTDADGRYSARGLRVGGPYTITVSKGDQKTVNEEVYLALAETTVIDLRLGAAQTQLEAVVVTGSAAANSKFGSGNAGAGTKLGRQDLDAYASISRSLQDYARIDPRVSQSDKERGEISIAGQNSRYNSITIDGVKINDTFGLEGNNLPTRKQPISIDAVQSVQVNISNYDVTQQGYTGGNINAVTKSGTNEYKGSVYYAYRDDSVVGRRFNRTTNTQFSFLPFEESTKGLTLGGPIIKDKLFFFASYEELKSNRVQPEFGPLGGNLTPVAITQNAIDQATQIAKNRYSWDIGSTDLSSKLLVKDSLIKLDWNISDKHRANLRFAKTEQEDTNNGTFTGRVDATNLLTTSQLWQQVKSIETVVGQIFSDWTDTFSTELKVSNRDYNSIPVNNDNRPAVSLQFQGAAPAGSPAGINTGNRFLNFGTEVSRHFNILDTKTQDAYLGANWFLDDHEIKFGVDWSSNKVFNAFFQNAKGTYTFRCENGTYSFGAVNCATASPALIEQAVLENWRNGRASVYQVQVPVVGGTLDDGIAKWTMTNTGLFLQDTWTLSKKLSLVAGVRLDQVGLDQAPARNAAAGAPTVAGSVGAGNASVVRNTGGFGLDNTYTVDGADLLQPRLAFTYSFDPVEKRKAQLRGGVGLFQGAAANVWLSNPFSNTGLTTRVVGCGIAGFSACVAGNTLFNPDPSQQPTEFGGSSAANVDFLQRDIAQPSVWKLNLAYDAELPGGFTFGAEWLFTKVKSAINYRHLNLGAPTRVGADGRELYYTPGAYDPACWSNSATNSTLLTTGPCAGNRTRALSNAAFNNVLIAEGTDKGLGNTLTLSLGQQRLGPISWNVAYSRASATEVNPLVSSISNSNWNGRAVFNPNEDVASRSNYVIRDRFSANANFSQAFFGKYKTTVGMFYEGRRGKPYSWVFGNDMNGDGVVGNDLIYIPKAPGSGEVVFLGDTPTNPAAETRFWEVVNADKGLSAAKGGVAGRNSSFAPFVNNIDMRFSQEVPGFMPGHKGVLVLDVLNLGNLINNRWGRIADTGFGQRRNFVRFAGVDASGKYIYNVTPADDLTVRQAGGESQWAFQVTLRYEF
jgi:Carboxypeptidase regulatory-like domain